MYNTIDTNSMYAFSNDVDISNLNTSNSTTVSKKLATQLSSNTIINILNGINSRELKVAKTISPNEIANILPNTITYGSSTYVLNHTKTGVLFYKFITDHEFEVSTKDLFLAWIGESKIENNLDKISSTISTAYLNDGRDYIAAINCIQNTIQGHLEHAGVIWNIEFSWAANINLEDFKDFLNEVLKGEISINGISYVINTDGYFVKKDSSPAPQRPAEEQKTSSSNETTRKEIVSGNSFKERLLRIDWSPLKLSTIADIPFEKQYLGCDGKKVRLEPILKTAKYLLEQGCMFFDTQENCFGLIKNKQNMFILSTDEYKQSVVRHEVMHSFFDNNREYRTWVWNTVFAQLNTEEKKRCLDICSW